MKLTSDHAGRIVEGHREKVEERLMPYANSRLRELGGYLKAEGSGQGGSVAWGRTRAAFGKSFKEGMKK